MLEFKTGNLFKLIPTSRDSSVPLTNVVGDNRKSEDLSSRGQHSLFIDLLQFEKTSKKFVCGHPDNRVHPRKAMEVNELEFGQLQKNILRKFRKKLRQIESLEQLSRPLNEEEIIKVNKKEEIRFALLSLSENFEDKENNISSQLNEAIKVENESLNLNDPKAISKNKKTSNEYNKKKFSCDWKNELFKVTTLKGHNDIITCVAAAQDFVVSSSRDTSVKVWDATSGDEIHSLRGHTGAVTCVILLEEDEGNKLLWYLGHDGKSRIAMSGSIDCMVKIWMISEGREIRSFYTFNEITCIGYLSVNQYIVTGTDGGKLELWNAVDSQNLTGVTSFGDGFTNIKVLDKRVFTSSSDGFIGIWELQGEELVLLFSSEKLLLNESSPSIPRKIRSLQLINNLIYYGDDGINMKVFDWETGDVKKFPNHLCQFGATDALCSTGNEILCSSYNLDYGYGSINVRLLPENEYITSIGDGQTGRILNMASCKSKGGKLRFVTGGTELKIWQAIGLKVPKQEFPNVDYVRTTSIIAYGGNVVNSEMESSESGSEIEDSDADWEPGSTTYIPTEIPPCHYRNSFFSWCTIL